MLKRPKHNYRIGVPKTLYKDNHHRQSWVDINKTEIVKEAELNKNKQESLTDRKH
jgi:hypothetical protein